MNSLCIDNISQKDRLVIISNNADLLSKNKWYIKVFVFNELINHKNADIYVEIKSLENLYKIFSHSFY
ncbi:hypothetical protein PL321_07340 [Caloramator sp. mosi_1]|uniref:hypothetical protein n=1 Tax=Caloramator sp. mosi_1 TaxID=3023090 RepID=UPI0023608B60|nr:hypothetical protein [Caloramator sp. mosi_1]WDC85257.1 hypothetical protein PL321_07340 [Caloramator sp. mosi_1]